MEGVSIAKKASDSFVSSANNSVEFILVRKQKDIEDPANVFHPEFTHQFFGDNESIFGYKDLCIKLYYSAAHLATYLGLNYTVKVDPAECEGVQPDDVLQVIGKKLPPGYFSNLEDFLSTISDDFHFVPYGCLIHSFECEPGCHFEIYKCDTTTHGFREYHASLQTFLLWFVDAASYIDMDDDRWNFYLVYEVYKNDGRRCYAIAGFATVYHYYAYPSHIRPRISQVLILPPFQRKGIGAELLQSIYNNYILDKNVLDITVEDPSDAFTKLRDFVDAKNCLQLSAFQPEKLIKGFSADMLSEAQTSLKLCKRQVRRVYELLRLGVTNVNNDDEYVPYRLDVKKRLNIPFQKEKTDLEKLKNTLRPDEFRATMQILNQEQRVEQLQRMYEELEEHYRHVLERLSADVPPTKREVVG